MISAPRAQILTDADCAGGTSYKTQEKMKLIFFFFFFLWSTSLPAFAS